MTADDNYLEETIRQFPGMPYEFVELLVKYVDGLKAETAVLRARLMHVTEQRDMAEAQAGERIRSDAALRANRWTQHTSWLNREAMNNNTKGNQ